MKDTGLIAKNWNLLKLQRFQQFDPDAKIRLGMKDWESVKLYGSLYDHQTPADEFLTRYAGQYDSVEYESSFFEQPSPEEMEDLRAQVEEVNPDFKFCPLIPRRISHEFELGTNHFDQKDFLESVDQLGKHLGPCILRLPETFSPAMIKILYRYLHSWPMDKKLAIHLTGEEWWKRPEAVTQLVKNIQGSQVSLLIEDKLEHPLHPEKLLTSDHLLVRFYARPGVGQDEQRLAMWVFKLGEFKGYGVKNPHFFLYEQEEMCLSILKRMANSIGGNTRIPQSYEIGSSQISFPL